jgi:class 3 adenylate cyclase
MDTSSPNVVGPSGRRRRCLRAVLAADVANFSGLVSVDETNTLEALWTTRRIAREELDSHGGWLFGMPGDGIFALFESAVDAVRCALSTQGRLSAAPGLHAIRLRVGVHLGEVLFEDGVPFGEPLVIAARLESFADPGGILVSAAVMEAVAPRVSAAFCERGMLSLKHCPRRVEAFSVCGASDLDRTRFGSAALDATVLAVSMRPGPGRLDANPVSLPVLSEPAAPKLPRAVPLVVKGPSDVESPAQPSEPIAAPTSAGDSRQTCLAEVSRALTTFLGPVAAILVARSSARFPDLFDLVDALAREIPVESERTRFLVQSHNALVRHHQQVVTGPDPRSRPSAADHEGSGFLQPG